MARAEQEPPSQEPGGKPYDLPALSTDAARSELVAVWVPPEIAEWMRSNGGAQLHYTLLEGAYRWAMGHAPDGAVVTVQQPWPDGSTLLTDHDRVRKERAEQARDATYENIEAEREALADAIRGLQSTDHPSLVPLHDLLMARYEALSDPGRVRIAKRPRSK